jgi:hypothetical protein
MPNASDPPTEQQSITRRPGGNFGEENMSWVERWYFLKFLGRALAIVWVVIVGGYFFFFYEKKDSSIRPGCEVDAWWDPTDRKPLKRDADELSSLKYVRSDGWQKMKDKRTMSTVWVRKADFDQRSLNPGCRPR